MPSAALSAVMCAVVMAAGSRMPEMSVWLKLAVQIVCGAAVYAGLAWAFKLESFCYLWGMVKNRLRGKD